MYLYNYETKYYNSIKYGWSNAFFKTNFVFVPSYYWERFYMVFKVHSKYANI